MVYGVGRRGTPAGHATGTKLKPDEGVLVPFGCPVYAYSKPQSGKGNPKWRLALFLGKTEAQDANIVGDGTQAMLTRSVRRLNRPWSKYLAYCSNFVTQSWGYQVNFGGRVVPSKRAEGPLPIQVPMKALPDGVSTRSTTRASWSCGATAIQGSW